MTDDPAELKRRLDETTARLRRADDPDDRYALGGDVRELEKQVEIAAAEAGDIDPPSSTRLLRDRPPAPASQMPRLPPLPVCPRCRRPLTFNGQTVKFECFRCDAGNLPRH